MSVRIGDVTFPDWRSLRIGRGWSDTFVFPISVYDGLPPQRRAKILGGMVNKVAKLRRSASIWVPVEGPDGFWFRREVQRSLKGLPLPVAVTPASVECPRLADFSFLPWTDRIPTPPPPETSPLFTAATSHHELACLHVLARVQSASTAEVASLAGCSIPTARQALKNLEGDWHISLEVEDRIPTWQINRRGISLSLRSWGVPAGMPFPSYKERKLIPGRHRRTTRFWPAWLCMAWPQAEIWTGWSEVTFSRCWPDALAWGRVDGFETLFWLEVESGHRSRNELVTILRRRFNQAIIYARRFPIRLVFVVLGQTWVQGTSAKVFLDLPHDAAVVMGDWLTFGQLALPGWGHINL
jgi:hypothetical protein